jgi:hypothetical protein
LLHLPGNSEDEQLSLLASKILLYYAESETVSAAMHEEVLLLQFTIETTPFYY